MKLHQKDNPENRASDREPLRSPRGAAFAAALFLWVIVPSVAGADNNKALARTLFETGVEEFSAQRYESALAAFEESYHIRPTPSLLYNIGMCQKALFRYRDAVESFRRYLEGANDPSHAHTARVRKELEDLSGLLVPIHLEGILDGAQVLLDDEPIAAGPLEGPLLIDPGAHTLTVKHHGHAAFERSIRAISASPLSIRVDLEPLPARLEVQCDSADATITIDNATYRGCPFHGALSPGDHKLRVAAPDRATFEQRLSLRAGEQSVVWAQLPRIPAADANASPYPLGRIRIAGAIALALGAGAGAVGGYFTYRGERDHRAGLNAIEDQDRADYDVIKNNRLPLDKIMMVSGYASAGVFLATGVALLLIGRSSEETKAPEQNISFTPRPDGFAVQF